MCGFGKKTGSMRYSTGKLVQPSQMGLLMTASMCLCGRKFQRKSTQSHDGMSAFNSLCSRTTYCRSAVSTLVTMKTPTSDMTMLSAGIAAATGGSRRRQWSRKTADDFGETEECWQNSAEQCPAV